MPFMTTAMATVANFDAMFWLISVTPVADNDLNRYAAKRVPTVGILQAVDLYMVPFKRS
jgi:hypothetical protein